MRAHKSCCLAKLVWMEKQISICLLRRGNNEMSFCFPPLFPFYLINGLRGPRRSPGSCLCHVFGPRWISVELFLAIGPDAINVCFVLGCAPQSQRISISRLIATDKMQWRSPKKRRGVWQSMNAAILTSACLFVGDGLGWIAVEALLAVMAMSSGRVMSTVHTDSARNTTRLLVQVQIEATTSGMTVAIARWNERRKEEKRVNNVSDLKFNSIALAGASMRGQIEMFYSTRRPACRSLVA